ncbi:MAG: helix-turn-helix domain-containing protein [Clostridia bacterium]|nr:helix-turn-helix domain-containing protein [Clostridia bacterium]
MHLEQTTYEIQEQLRINRMIDFFTAYKKTEYIFSGHSHNYWETMYILSGSVCVTGNDRVYDLSEGDMIFHEPMEMHKFYTTSANTKLLIFSYELEGNMADFFRQKVFTLTKQQKSIISALLTFVNTRTEGNASAYSLPEHYVEDNRLRYITPVKTDPAYGHELVLYLYLLMLNLANAGKTASPSDSYESVLFGSAVKFMTDNISETFSVNDVAKHINMSISGLKRIFKKRAGMGVHKYFLTLKINQATEMLEGGLSVNDVAAKLGFSSPSCFTRAYKREANLPPSRVKQKNKGLSK